MFIEVPAPHPALGKKRFQKELPIKIEQVTIHRLCIYFT